MLALLKSCPKRTDHTIDVLPCGKITLIQPRDVARVSTETLLLASVVPRGFVGAAVDLGAGTGAVAMRVAAHSSASCVTAVENDGVALDALRQTVLLPKNAPFGRRITVVAAHVGDVAGIMPAASVDAVLFNPPWFLPGSGRRSPHKSRDAARYLTADGLGPWFTAARHLLRRGGFCAATLLPALLADALEALGPLGSVRILPVLPRPTRDARAVILAARLGGRAQTRLLPPLLLTDDKGHKTERLIEIEQGEPALAEQLY